MSSKLSAKAKLMPSGISPIQAALISQVLRVPAGWVASYGQIARLAGLPRHARHVGRALSSLPEGSTVPWWRIVSSEGRIPARGLNGHDDQQRLLLEEEGIVFDSSSRIDLRIFGWKE